MYVCNIHCVSILSTPQLLVLCPISWVHTTLTTVVLTWNPPQQSNGIFRPYAVTYRVNGSGPVTGSTDDPDTTFIISSLFSQTTISDISVRASTSAGPGPEVTLEDVVTLTRPREYQ